MPADCAPAPTPAARFCASFLAARPLALLSERELVAAMRAEEPAAFHEFYERFTPLLRHVAHSLGIMDKRWREELATDVATDLAVQFIRPGARIPYPINPYATAALRHRIFDARLTAKRIRRTAMEAADVGSGAIVSEFTRRASAGAYLEAEALSERVVTLAREVDAAMSPKDRAIAEAVGDHVPMSVAAAEVGLTLGAGKQQILRLRRRLQQRYPTIGARVQRELVG